MISSTKPIFAQLAEQEAQKRKEQEREKAARSYERSIDGMFNAIELVFGQQAAQQIKEQGYTATIDGERFWRFDRFAFQPYQFGSCGDPDSKWFRFTVMESAKPEEQKRLVGVRACDDMKDVYDHMQTAEQNRVDREAKAIRLTMGKEINPMAMRLHGMIKRIEAGETHAFDRLIMALIKFNADTQYGDDDGDDDGDD